MNKQLIADAEVKFWPKVNTDGDCWLWTGTIDAGGYGRLKYKGANLRAHRVAYEVAVGPIPDGLTIDHVCHNRDSCSGGKTCPHRRCVNPDHLTPATAVENMKRGHGPLVQERKTHCKHGHEFSEENTYVYPNGHRRCLTCGRESMRRKRAE